MTVSKRHSMSPLSALLVIDKWLPPLGMTSVPEEPLKPAQARELHEAYRALMGVVEQYQTALDRLWEAHDQLCGCDQPANEGTCSAPEETWGAFEYLGWRDRDSESVRTPSSEASDDPASAGTAQTGERKSAERIGGRDLADPGVRTDSDRCTCTRDGEGYVESRECPVHNPASSLHTPSCGRRDPHEAPRECAVD